MSCQHGYFGYCQHCAELDALLRARGRNEEISDQKAEIERLRAELAASQADAARYRWLVANSFDREGVAQLHVWLHTWEPHSQTGDPTEWKQRVRGPAIGWVIDAAIRAIGDAE